METAARRICLWTTRTSTSKAGSPISRTARSSHLSLSGEVAPRVVARSRSPAPTSIVSLSVLIDKDAILGNRSVIMEADKTNITPRKQTAKAGLRALRSKIEATENGKVRVRGLGVFIIKTSTKEVEGQVVTSKRVKLRLAGNKARKRQPAPPETGSESPASEHDA